MQDDVNFQDESLMQDDVIFHTVYVPQLSSLIKISS